MRLYVFLLEARDLPVKDSSYVKLQVGKHSSKSRVLKNAANQNPFWNEEFVFRVRDLDDELVVSVYDDGGVHDEDKHLRLFNVHHHHRRRRRRHGELVGRVKIPVQSVAAESNWNFPATWFSLERPENVRASSIDGGCGKLLLALSLHKRGQRSSSSGHVSVLSNSESDDGLQSTFASPSQSKRNLEIKPWVRTITNRFDKFFNKKTETTSRNDHFTDPSTPSEYEDCLEEPTITGSSFADLLELMQSRNEDQEMPENLRSGILLDRTYGVSSKDLNMVIFAPDSELQKQLAELQGTTDVHEEPWVSKSEDTLCLKRAVSYTKAATKLVRATKAIEDQTYVKAKDGEFAVFVSVSTPDVPYGSAFKVELLYKIIPSFERSSGEETSRLVISWAVNFTQNTMMKGMIENGVKQGLKDNFEQFSSLLSEKFEVVEGGGKSDKDHMLEMVKAERNSDSESMIRYFFKFTVVSAFFMLSYVLVHIFLCQQKKPRGLEFKGLELPDSFGELITSGLLVLQLERVYYMISHFVEAKLRRGSDHGIKAQGEGWILTAALIEGKNLASMNTNGAPDPYVVLTCNGKTRKSSVKLQTLDPRWNEILEFDAAEDPPSVLDVEVLDFNGALGQASSIGHAEINFLKHTADELADLWVPLDGKLARSYQSKLHLRIFLDNNNGVDTIRDYLSNLEKEVGKKLSLSSPHRNSNFLKIFGLPAEEFLISDFSCSLKRKMPLLGRIFLSARVIGFYANLFGHKTRFFFLWEDVEDIHVLPSSISTVGSPTLVIILHKGLGLDARHGAKLLDEEGRLHFHFHSFVSFHAASRTIMALWRTRTLEPEQKEQIVEEQAEAHDKPRLESEEKDRVVGENEKPCDEPEQNEQIVEERVEDDETEKPCLVEDTRPDLNIEDVKMDKVYSKELPVNVKSLMKMFDGGDLERKVMIESGRLNYTTTAWEHVTPKVQERQVSYKFSRRVSILGGEIESTQKKHSLPNDGGWVVIEEMTLHGLPRSDHSRLYLRYSIEKSSSTHDSCKCEIFIGVLWLKSPAFEAMITKNIISRFGHLLEGILKLVEREILLTNQ